MTATEALRQCIEAMKLVDFKDCAESEELWHKFNLAQANAERLLRDGEKQEPAVNAFDAMTKYSGASIATTYWMEQEDFYLADDVKAAIAAHPAPSLQAVGAVPEGYALVPLVATDDMIVAFAEQWYSKRQVIDDPDMADAYKAMLAAAPQPAAAPSGDAWQPIETAPKGKNGVSFMMLANGPEDDQSVSIGMQIDGKFYAGSVFYCLGNKEKPFEIREHKVQPTHWMPMPDTPATKE